MKYLVFSVTWLLLVSCSSGGGSNSSGGSSSGGTNNPPVEPEVNQAEQTIQQEYPKVAYSEVGGLKTYAEFPIGLEVQAADEARSIFTLTEQQPLIEQHFNELVAGIQMKAPFLHPEENVFTFDDADELVDYALANNMRMHGHTLIWYFNDNQTVMPDWMLNYSGDWDAMMENHITEIVEHFKSRVHSWDVVNEAIDLVRDGDGAMVGAFRNTPFYQNLGESYIAKAFNYANQADPDATLYYNDWALSHNDAKLDFTLDMINALLADNVPVHGIGFEMHVWIDYPSAESIKAALTKAAATGLMIKISELDVRSSVPYNAPISHTPPSSLSPELSLQQKDRYKEIVKAYLEAVPPAQRGGITFWGLVDGESWINSIVTDWPLLFHDDLSVKPAFYGVVEALTGQ